jgi:hypothetical protein
LPFPSEVGFILFRQVIDDVAFLVNLTALEEGCLASVPADRRRPGLAALYDLPPWRAEIASALPPIAQQGSHDGRVLGCSFAPAQPRFASVTAEAQGRDHLPILARSAVDPHGAKP